VAGVKEEEKKEVVGLLEEEGEEREMEGPAEEGRGVRAKEEARLDMVSVPPAPPFDCCC